MEVRVLVTLQVEACDPDDFKGSTGEFQQAAVDAIEHAVKYGENQGFVHPLANDVSIGVVAVELDERKEDSDVCEECGGELKTFMLESGKVLTEVRGCPKCDS